MDLAFKEAKKAFKQDEVPIGAILVKNGEIIAKSHNKKEKKMCCLEHAELNVIKKASKKLKNWRLEDCDLYVTLDPCPMCASAIEQARIKRIITGAVNNNNETNRISSEILKNRLWTKKIKQEVCTNLMNDFFKKKR